MWMLMKPSARKTQDHVFSVFHQLNLKDAVEYVTEVRVEACFTLGSAGGGWVYGSWRRLCAFRASAVALWSSFGTTASSLISRKSLVMTCWMPCLMSLLTRRLIKASCCPSGKRTVGQRSEWRGWLLNLGVFSIGLCIQANGHMHDNNA